MVHLRLASYFLHVTMKLEENARKEAFTYRSLERKEAFIFPPRITVSWCPQIQLLLVYLILIQCSALHCCPQFHSEIIHLRNFHQVDQVLPQAGQIQLQHSRKSRGPSGGGSSHLSSTSSRQSGNLARVC